MANHSSDIDGICRQNECFATVKTHLFKELVYDLRIFEATGKLTNPNLISIWFLYCQF